MTAADEAFRPFADPAFWRLQLGPALEVGVFAKLRSSVIVGTMSCWACATEALAR